MRNHLCAELLRIIAECVGRIVPVFRHIDDISADDLPVLLEVSVGHIERLAMIWRVRVENQLSKERENVVVASDRKQYGRQRCNDAEQPDDANMKPGSGLLVPPCLGKPDRLPADDGEHRKDQDDVDEQHRQDDLIPRHDGREPGQDEIGREPGNERQNDDDKADPEGERVRFREWQPSPVYNSGIRSIRISGHHPQRLSSACRAFASVRPRWPVVQTSALVRSYSVTLMAQRRQYDHRSAP